jgi:chromosome condensin MukBEF MukE localization factor
MDFKNATNEWIAIKTQLAAARKDLGTLNQREKELRKFVTQHMAVNEIDTVKVQDKVKVNLKLKKGLSTFFGGNEVQVEGAFNAIQDAVEVKEIPGVTVSGIKNLLA